MTHFIFKSEHLAAMYELLPAKKQDYFRTALIQACGWTYAKWRNKLTGRTQLNILEAKALQDIIKDPYLTELHPDKNFSYPNNFELAK